LQRAFLSPPNWFGFEALDYLLLAIAVGFVLWNRPALRWRVPFPHKHGTWAAVLFALPIALRLALLHRYPVPVPSGADDFGYLLLADTLRHFRLANPPHAFPEFFEQVFVLQRPTYSSMFNLAQGLVLALGWILFAQPWVGVLLSVGALCALVYWMLLGWSTPQLALAGGLLAVMLFGPLCYWTNCYWGGALPACAGCLAFGSVARLRKQISLRYALLLGTGLSIHLLSRPFESIFLFGGIALLLPWRGARRLAWVALPVLSAAGLIGLQNKSVTGSWTTLPYQLYRYQYGVPATFTFQPSAVPHVDLNPEKQADYEVETATHGFAPEAPRSYVKRLSERIRFVRFFLFAPLYLAAIAGCFALPRVGVIVFAFLLGSNFYPYFYPHYIAGATCLFLLLAITGLQRLRRAGPAIWLLCALQFMVWYGTFLLDGPKTPTWNFVNGPDPQGRATIAHELASHPGKQLVFVHYSPEHRFAEWVHNAAEIDSSPVIYVNDIDPIADRQLRNHYPDRRVWLLEPDAEPPRLQPFETLDKPADKPFLDVP
jgi:hypothetical protein